VASSPKETDSMQKTIYQYVKGVLTRVSVEASEQQNAPKARPVQAPAEIEQMKSLSRLDAEATEFAQSRLQLLVRVLSTVGPPVAA
jgi:hypothetical protein